MPTTVKLYVQPTVILLSTRVDERADVLLQKGGQSTETETEEGKPLPIMTGENVGL
jgi:hypothetical protein